MSSVRAVIYTASVVLCFGLIHSLCVTEAVKHLIRKLLGDTFVRAFYRLIYTFFSVLTTALAVWLILLMPDIIIWRAPFWLSIIMRAVQAGAFVFGAFSFKAVQPMEFIGVAQAYRYIRWRRVEGDMEGITGKGLIKTGVYGIVRHPLYLSGIVLFISQPVITRNWLTVQALAVIYFIYGAFIEEKRLIRRFGQEYIDYMKQVPRFLPRLSRSKA